MTKDKDNKGSGQTYIKFLGFEFSGPTWLAIVVLIAIVIGTSIYYWPNIKNVILPNKNGNGTESSNGQMSTIDIEIKKLEEQIASIPRPPGPLDELQAVRQERESKLRDIEELQNQPMPKDQLHALEKRKINIQNELKKLQEYINNAEKINSLETKINNLKKNKAD